MKIVVTMKSQEPLYEQIKKQIIYAIINKQVGSGEKLPSVRVLAKELGVGVITVKRAYDDLVLEGFIISKEAVGYFINDLKDAEIKKNLINEIKEKLTNIKKEAFKYSFTKEELNKIWEDIIDE